MQAAISENLTASLFNSHEAHAERGATISKKKSTLDCWLEQLGIVKKLQVALVLSWILIILMGMQLISSESKQKLIKTIAQTSAVSSSTDIESFARNYINKLFATNSDENMSFLQEHSDSDLYLNNIYPELKAREKQKIHSEFQINQLYIEAENETKSKIVCFGKESFPQGSYQSRELTLELLLDTSKLKVLSIPVFRAEGL